MPLTDLTWSGTDGTISGSGAWTAPTKVGSYTITARQGSVSGSITVTVVPRALDTGSAEGGSATANWAPATLPMTCLASQTPAYAAQASSFWS